MSPLGTCSFSLWVSEMHTTFTGVPKVGRGMTMGGRWAYSHCAVMSSGFRCKCRHIEGDSGAKMLFLPNADFVLAVMLLSCVQMSC